MQDLKQQVEIKGSEIRTLNATIDGLKSVKSASEVHHRVVVSYNIAFQPRDRREHSTKAKKARLLPGLLPLPIEGDGRDTDHACAIAPACKLGGAEQPDRLMDECLIACTA